MDSEILTHLRSFSTVLVMFAFAGVCWWAYAPRRKKRFDEAANLPFADDPADTAIETDSTTGAVTAGDKGQEKS